jgi:hypothetical protein
LPPAVAEQDNTDVLALTLNAVRATLGNATTQDALALNTLCYVDGELLAYATATLTGAGAYQLSGLVRGAYGTTPGQHLAGTQFARLDNAVFQYTFLPGAIGTTLSVKFVSFNIYGGGAQTLANVPAYSYTLRGAALTSALPAVTGLACAYIAMF